MIPAGIQVYVASMPVDFRKGATGLMALVRDGGADPFDGALYVFRSKRADRIKAVWFDGTGVCLFAKTLEDAQFCWPRIGPAMLRSARSDRVERSPTARKCSALIAL
jgi:transposase